LLVAGTDECRCLVSAAADAAAADGADLIALPSAVYGQDSFGQT